jgi:hypothetical protein
MNDYRRIEPGSAARAAESAPRLTSRRIEGGSAAKAAEERAKNAEDVPPEAVFRGSVGLKLRVSNGAKFELPHNPQGTGEAMPLVSNMNTEVSPAKATQVLKPEQVSTSDASTQGSGGETKGIFRRLFRR